MPINATNTFNTIVSGVKNLNTEISSLTPTTPIILYEIDMRDVYPQTAFINVNDQPMLNGILRLFNDINLFNLATNTKGRVYWQGNYYYPFPINAEGFELNSVGSLPTPKILIANTSPDGSQNSFYKFARLQIQSLGDLAGCKFTRIKTFLKYLDPINFENNFNPFSKDNNFFELELPRDVYYIERKSLETKNLIEYSLSSILDLENVSLPARQILTTKCPFQYRGEGCLYEFQKRISPIHSGVYNGCSNIANNYITLPLEAPPTATDNDELFLGKIFTGAKVNGIADTWIFSGINYKKVGDNASDSVWTFLNYDLRNGSQSLAQTALNDNNFNITGANSNANGPASITIALNMPEEITRLSLTSSTTVENNYHVFFSKNQGINWEIVHHRSGAEREWRISGGGAGSYITGWETVGSHTHWRISGTNIRAGTNLTELQLSGQFRVGDSGLWGLGNTYRRGEYVYFEKLGLKSYYVCLSGHLSNPFNAPPNIAYWSTDQCSKSISSCRLRWQLNPYFRPVFWPMSRGGWNRDKMYRHFNRYGYSPSGKDIGALNGTQASTAAEMDTWPRRPMVWNPLPSNQYAWGLPKDYTGDYLNGFLPFGGFPGVNKRS